MIAALLVQAAIYGDAEISTKENSFKPKVGIQSQERLCVISPGFLNCIPLRISSPTSVGRLTLPHFDLFTKSSIFAELCICFRFQFAQTDYKFFSSPQAQMPQTAGNYSALTGEEDKHATSFNTKFFDKFLEMKFMQLRVLDLSWNNNYLCDAHLKKLAEVNPPFLYRTLEELDLSGNSRISPSGLAALVYLIPNKSLSNNNENSKTYAVESSPQRKNLLPGIQTLRLQRCAWIDDQALRNSISKLRTLRHLDLGSTNVSSDEFASLLDLNHLHSLDLESCNRVDDWCFKNLKRKNDERIKIEKEKEESSDQKKESASTTMMGTPQVSAFSDMMESKFTDTLQILNLKNNSRITDETLKIVAQLFPNLRQLLLTNCTRITSRGVTEICHGSELLERLDIVSVPTVRSRFASLNRRSSAASSNNSNSAQSNSQQQQQDEEDAKMMVTNKLLEEDLWHLSELKTLLMAGYSNISEASFCTFISRSASCLKSGQSPLMTLDIGNCTNLKESALEEIGRCCPHLERLVLAGNAGIEKSSAGRFSSINYGTDEEREEAFSSFRVMVSGLKNLKVLDVTETLISDYCLKCLAQNCPLISVLTLSMCVKLSDGGLIFLRHLKNLKHIHAFRCPLMTRRGIEVLQKCLPGIIVTGQ